MSSTEPFWPARLRWRLRGAWQWPAFAALTLVDALILHLLPPLRLGIDPGIGLPVIPALVVATFGNLLLVGAIAPWLARRLAARSLADPAAAGASQAPREVLEELYRDRAATALLAAGALAVLAAGLASRPLVVSETEATEENAAAVRRFVLHSGDPELVRNLETASTRRLGEGYFRTCIARDDRRRHFCLFVDTEREPPEVRRDPSEVPNRDFLRR